MAGLFILFFWRNFQICSRIWLWGFDPKAASFFLLFWRGNLYFFNLQLIFSTARFSEICLFLRFSLCWLNWYFNVGDFFHSLFYLYFLFLLNNFLKFIFALDGGWFPFEWFGIAANCKHLKIFNKSVPYVQFTWIFDVENNQILGFLGDEFQHFFCGINLLLGDAQKIKLHHF